MLLVVGIMICAFVVIVVVGSVIRLKFVSRISVSFGMFEILLISGGSTFYCFGLMSEMLTILASQIV